MLHAHQLLRDEEASTTECCIAEDRVDVQHAISNRDLQTLVSSSMARLR